jgi:HD-GYP domain-containing protein (c-di-GMP phosphodiesterase class II)
MRFVHIDEVKPGMMLAKTLYNEDSGTILLKANVPIIPVYIRRMKELGYEYICVKDPDDQDVAVKIDPVREETRAKGLKIVKETMSRLARNVGNVDVEQINEIIDDIITQIIYDPKVGFDLVQIRNLNNYIFMHSVNVGVISVLLGSLMGLGRNDLGILGAGAILHDVGNVTIDQQILNKADKLSPEEYEIIKSHPKTGFDILKSRVSLSFLSAHIAYEHHEREDGSGYPRGLKGDQIHIFAKITSVADSYDAMTCCRARRTGRFRIPIRTGAAR